LVDQHNIDHGGFIDYNNVGLQRIVTVAFEGKNFGIKFEQAVDGFGLQPGRFGKALGRSACGRTKDNAGILGSNDAQNTVDQGGFTDTGSTCNDQDLVS